VISRERPAIVGASLQDSGAPSSEICFLLHPMIR
jgi:hypothetical protein